MAGVVYIEVRGDMDEFAVFQEVYGPTGIASDVVQKLADTCLRHALQHSPIGNPLDYGAKPASPGQYIASWNRDRRGTNVGSYQQRVSNLADHASIVEFGRRHTFGGQRFTWSKARKVTYRKRGGRFVPVGSTPNPGGLVVTDNTRGREGKHVLANAQRYAAARYGLATT